jgi:hypothetical protein
MTPRIIAVVATVVLPAGLQAARLIRVGGK